MRSGQPRMHVGAGPNAFGFRPKPECIWVHPNAFGFKMHLEGNMHIFKDSASVPPYTTIQASFNHENGQFRDCQKDIAITKLDADYDSTRYDMKAQCGAGGQPKSDLLSTHTRL
jgi:hypothetical protein